MRSFRRLVLLCALACLASVAAKVAYGESAEPDSRPNDAFDFMNLLFKHGLHDYKDERWNAYGQLTWISSFKLPFHAPYTDLNGSNHSLQPGFEHSFTGTLTAFFGVKLWRGSEVIYVPEVIMEKPLSHLAGLGGAIQNFELQKTGGVSPTLYTSRFYIRQTFDLGGHHVEQTSQPMQLEQGVKSRRLVLTFGNFSVLDVLDKNGVVGDMRRGFFNMAFLTYAAYDFAADARGYTWGGAAELYWDDWAFRFVHVITPKEPNQLPLDDRFWKYFGQQIEIEHDHSIKGRPGAVRLLAYRNHEDMAKFADAIKAFSTRQSAATCPGSTFSYGSTNATAPDFCWARRPNVKWGIGASIEQVLWRDIGFFARGMYSDGQTEVYSFSSSDRSLSLGVLAHGSSWKRRRDYAGVAFGASWISAVHARYLAMGGVDGFIGDGALKQGVESVLEVSYGFNVWSSLFLSLDYQYITNPGYNVDRGPVNIFGARFHAEF